MKLGNPFQDKRARIRNSFLSNHIQGHSSDDSKLSILSWRAWMDCIMNIKAIWKNYYHIIPLIFWSLSFGCRQKTSAMHSWKSVTTSGLSVIYEKFFFKSSTVQPNLLDCQLHIRTAKGKKIIIITSLTGLWCITFSWRDFCNQPTGLRRDSLTQGVWQLVQWFVYLTLDMALT